MAKKKTRTIKQKKKSWYNVVAPKVFNETNIGEATAVDPSNLVGRSVKVNMMNLTRNIRKQSITVTFKINEIKDNKATTYVSSFMTSPAAIKRMIRRRRDKVEDSLVCKTKDGKLVRIKPLVLTKSNAKNSVLTTIRQILRYLFLTKVVKLTYGEFIELVLNDKLVKEIKYKLSLIYPVRQVSLKAFKLEENSRAKATPLTQNNKDAYKLLAEKEAIISKRKASKDNSSSKTEVEKK